MYSCIAPSAAHLAGCTKHRANLVELIHLAAAGKKRTKRIQLGHDAAHGPEIDGAAVIGGVQQHLRRSIPTRRYVIRKRRTWTYLSRQSKVGNFDKLRPGAEQILRLQIAMKKTMAMHECQSRQDLNGKECYEIYNRYIPAPLTWKSILFSSGSGKCVSRSLIIW